ncbi:MAG: site-2 protease family protein [Candidatus Woesebacteria bacterium]|jgi:Zn-dependent protease
MISLLFSQPLVFLVFFPGLLMSIVIHEFAHSLAADKLGDPTPRVKGRLTLDPRVHLDPIGTIAILLTRFGWGKPAPFDPFNLKEPVRDTALIALAGPVSNLAVALLLSIVIKLGLIPFMVVNTALISLVIINIMLAVFNLLPIYPLDGSKILTAILPKTTAIEYERFMERYGTLVLLLLIFPIFTSVSPAARLISPIINLIADILL